MRTQEQPAHNLFQDMCDEAVSFGQAAVRKVAWYILMRRHRDQHFNDNFPFYLNMVCGKNSKGSWAEALSHAWQHVLDSPEHQKQIAAELVLALGGKEKDE